MSGLKITLPAPCAFILSRLHENGFEAYAVGGCVRDSLLHKTPHDWDITTAAKPEKIIELFSDIPVLETGLKHGTVTLLIDRTVRGNDVSRRRRLHRRPPPGQRCIHDRYSG